MASIKALFLDKSVKSKSTTAALLYHSLKILIEKTIKIKFIFDFKASRQQLRVWEKFARFIGKGVKYTRVCILSVENDHRPVIIYLFAFFPGMFGLNQ